MRISKETGLKLVYEKGEKSGIVKVAGMMASDIEKCLGFKPETVEAADEAAVRAVEGAKLIFGEAGSGRAIGSFTEKADKLAGMREVYVFETAGEDTLVIAGSDKRGTIYGLFHISDLLGVSPFVNWSDVKPAKREALAIEDKDSFVSKIPSVEYRGFFINDEWPCFGNWCAKNFGGVNAKMYAGVFEILLRMKGNYLWPAMWASNFALDGPGLESAELADELGVVMGLSHHEPCLRHGEEYTMVRGKDSKYGDAWDFLSNEKGITEFWRDGLKRNGHLENVITLGMRGERDSMIMAEAGLKANIDLIKKVLTTQNKLIREEVCPDLTKVPRMIALYKEVEAYYYGDESAEGLMDYPELDDVILMLCDDNHGYVRTLPDDKMRSHKGGFGMYYHFDYHGGPVSYEWIDSTHLPAVWEQMTTAYERGINRLWIVNVGDLGMNEVPLNYFLDLAYDYEKWGISAPNMTDEYLHRWFKKQFGAAFDDETVNDIADMYIEYGRIMNNRRPEHMSRDVYSVSEGFEGSRMLERIKNLEERCERAYAVCPAEYKDAYLELVRYKVLAGMNLIKLWIYSGYNHYYASLGLIKANDYADKVKQCMIRDTELTEELHKASDGKWYGFGMAEHIGFKHWNCEERTNPTLEYVLPLPKSEAMVGISGEQGCSCGEDWTAKRLKLSVYDKEDGHKAYASVFVAARGALKCSYEAKSADEWISLENAQGEVSEDKCFELINVTIDKDRLKGEGEHKGLIEVHTGCGRVYIDVYAYVSAKGVFSERNGCVVIEAAHYSRLSDGREGSFKLLKRLGRNEDAIKLFPVDKSIENIDAAPYAEYEFTLDEEGEYDTAFLLEHVNPYLKGRGIELTYSVNGGEAVCVPAISKTYDAGTSGDWGQGVLNHVRIVKNTDSYRAGTNTIRFYGMQVENVLERVMVIKKGIKVPNVYLGIDETGRMDQ